MKTVTFFSYKGGTGRSLAVANASRYLARFGFHVVALDLDLEAPGLHYKFSQDPSGSPISVRTGVVDWLHEILEEGKYPADGLRSFCCEVPQVEQQSGSITLIPAGCVDSADYWPKLGSLDWHSLFYTDESPGVAAFMELKQTIENELRPDFLIIDSRTGVTEMGGVAATILADAVIALVLRSRENLDGSRAVLRSLVKTRASFSLPPLALTVALSRVPASIGTELEHTWAEEVRAFLNEPAANLLDTLTIERVELLHIDEALHTRECLRVGGNIGPNESLLYRDYLRCFRGLVS
ncbi:MAG: hypothetical protein NT069_14365 [Planctomycetota bacterium]|nr:hypothetical protein [Planctomycetota bacterium]